MKLPCRDCLVLPICKQVVLSSSQPSYDLMMRCKKFDEFVKFFGTHIIATDLRDEYRNEFKKVYGILGRRKQNER